MRTALRPITKRRSMMTNDQSPLLREERAPRNCQGTITRRSGVVGWLIVGSLRNYVRWEPFADRAAAS